MELTDQSEDDVPIINYEGKQCYLSDPEIFVALRKEVFPM